MMPSREEVTTMASLGRAVLVRIQQVEEKVLRALDVIIAEGSIEDSRIECKRDWPNVEKVRQLAAHANAAHGEPIIWIIGVDDKNRQVTGFDESIEPSNWWTAFEKKFDQGVAPDLIHSVVVVPEDQPRVMALLFDTSRCPYVINLEPGGRVSKEVPIRKSSGTRSASRNDLLRLLVPLTYLPEVSIVSAQLSPHYYTADGSKRRRDGTAFTLNADFFFAYSSDRPIFLPQHEMNFILKVEFAEGEVMALSAQPEIYVGKNPSDPPRFGIHRRTDGFGITGSGLQHLSVSFHSDRDLRESFRLCRSIKMAAIFPLAGDGRSIEASAELSPSERHRKIVEGPNYWTLQEWELDTGRLELS